MEKARGKTAARKQKPPGNEQGSGRKKVEWGILKHDKSVMAGFPLGLHCLGSQNCPFLQEHIPGQYRHPPETGKTEAGEGIGTGSASKLLLSLIREMSISEALEIILQTLGTDVPFGLCHQSRPDLARPDLARPDLATPQAKEDSCG